MTLGPYLDDLTARLGPVDAVVLWASLPTLGLDARSQFDLLAQVPGGPAALAAAAVDAAARVPPVALMVGYLPWDTGTAPGPASDATLLTGVMWNASLAGAYGRDCASPTCLGAPFYSYNTSVFGLQPDGALGMSSEVETGGAPLGYTPLSRVNLAAMGVPPATAAATAPWSAYHWLEGRHAAVWGSDWATAKASDVVAGFVNGGAASVSENVWGFTNLLTPRDAGVIMRTATLTRFVSPFVRSVYPPPTPSPSPTPTPSATPSSSPSSSPSASATPAGSPTASLPASPSASPPPPSATPSETPTPLETPTPTLSPGTTPSPAVVVVGAARGSSRSHRAARRALRAAEVPVEAAAVATEAAVSAGRQPLRADAVTDSWPWVPNLPTSNPAVLASQYGVPCPSAVFDDSRDSLRNLADLAVASRAAVARRTRQARDAVGLGPPCTLFLFANTDTAMGVFDVAVEVGAAWARVNATLYPTLFWYDLYQGAAINVTVGGGGRGGDAGVALPPAALTNTTLTLSLEVGSVGAVLASPVPAGATLTAFLTLMRTNVTAVPVAALDNTWLPAQQVASPIVPTRGSPELPSGMVLIPGGLGYTFAVNASLPEAYSRADAAGVVGSGGVGVDVQYAWESAPCTAHAAVFDILPFFIDATPVTNEEVAAWVASPGYNASARAPVTNYLAHWVVYPNGTRSYPPGAARRPVVWMSRGDAAAFCAWRGRRLPYEVEWQFAAQASRGAGPAGTDYRPYPWGTTPCADTPDACPTPDASRDPRSPDAVSAHPAGNSPHGVADLVGNVWQLTDAYCDVATCGVVLRGGSLYTPVDASAPAAGFASRYWPQAQDAGHHVKAPYGMDWQLRSAYVGFRCVADAVPHAAGGADYDAFSAGRVAQPGARFGAAIFRRPLTPP